MNYTPRDLARYTAFILGCSLTYLTLGQLGVEHHLAKLIAGIAVGVGLGWVAHLATKPDPKPGDDRRDRDRDG